MRVDARARSWVMALVTLSVIGASPAVAQTQLVIVSGLGGQAKYHEEFGWLSNALADAANQRAGLPDSAIVWLGDSTLQKNRASKWFRGVSSKANIERVMASLAQRPDGEQLVLILIGHGSGEREESRISLPGADLSAKDFDRLLDGFGSRRVAFVNLTSGSGDMLPLLAAPGRVVMTATKSAFERNESQFGRYFVEAFVKDGADIDKDNRVSLFEAFKYAEAETKRYYETDGKLPTEHSQMADEGELSRRFFLAAGASVPAGGDARLTALYKEKFRLDEEISALRTRKPRMAADEYEKELERLLIALAEKSQEIRKLERGS
jgi:hypothetical protein